MKNQFELKNKNSLITGAAGLLGEQHARAILEVNGRVILVDINLASLKKLRERLLKDFSSDKIIIYKMDVTSEISIKKVIKILQKKKISVDILKKAYLFLILKSLIMY